MGDFVKYASADKVQLARIDHILLYTLDAGKSRRAFLKVTKVDGKAATRRDTALNVDILRLEKDPKVTLMPLPCLSSRKVYVVAVNH